MEGFKAEGLAYTAKKTQPALTHGALAGVQKRLDGKGHFQCSLDFSVVSGSFLLLSASAEGFSWLLVLGSHCAATRDGFPNTGVYDAQLALEPTAG